MVKILVAEDDEKLNKAVSRYLSGRGYQVFSCMNGEDALELLAGQMVDMVISDIMMPEMDGFVLADSIRQLDKAIPILFMTALDDIDSKKKGFRLGIDDYMVKPIDFDELQMRVEALLRRANIAMEKKLAVGSLTLDADEMTAYVDGAEVPLTVREFQVLYKLLSYPKKTFTRAQLMDEFWGYETESDSRTVDVYITKLRSKFRGCDAFEIATVHGLGYKALVRGAKG